MSKSRRPPKSAAINREKVLRAVLAGGENGASKSELIAATGMSESGVTEHLHRLRGEGVIERSHHSGAFVRWGEPGIAARYATRTYSSKYHEATARSLKAAYDRRRNSGMGRNPLNIVQRVVDARQAPPLRPTGPVSVWALGRAA